MINQTEQLTQRGWIFCLFDLKTCISLKNREESCSPSNNLSSSQRLEALEAELKVERECSNREKRLREFFETLLEKSREELAITREIHETGLSFYRKESERLERDKKELKEANKELEKDNKELKQMLEKDNKELKQMLEKDNKELKQEILALKHERLRFELHAQYNPLHKFTKTTASQATHEHPLSGVVSLPPVLALMLKSQFVICDKPNHPQLAPMPAFNDGQGVDSGVTFKKYILSYLRDALIPLGYKVIPLTMNGDGLVRIGRWTVLVEVSESDDCVNAELATRRTVVGAVNLTDFPNMWLYITKKTAVLRIAEVTCVGTVCYRDVSVESRPEEDSSGHGKLIGLLKEMHVMLDCLKEYEGFGDRSRLWLHRGNGRVVKALDRDIGERTHGFYAGELEAVWEIDEGEDYGLLWMNLGHEPSLKRDELLESLWKELERLEGIGVVHGDIHPWNVVQIGEEVYLIDFDMAVKDGETYRASLTLDGVYKKFRRDGIGRMGACYEDDRHGVKAIGELRGDEEGWFKFFCWRGLF